MRVEKALLVLLVLTSVGCRSSIKDKRAEAEIALAKHCAALGAAPSDPVWKLQVDGVERSFRVYLPSGYDHNAQLPLVVHFHGFTTNAAFEEDLTHMSVKAEASRFVLVYPEGTGNLPGWNAGGCCGEAAGKDVDDVKFVSAMLDALEAKLCIDHRRVFATGMSNGAFMTHRVACELADRFAAAAPVAGMLVTPKCEPSRPISILSFHGNADLVVPYNDNQNLWPKVPTVFASWAARDGCSGEPRETFHQDDVSCQTYAACRDSTEVTLCTIDGGGHTWPGGTPTPEYGKTTQAISANDVMWAFFEKHPLY